MMITANALPVVLSVERINFRITFLDSGIISSNWGPTLRGGFGKALRKVACSLGYEKCKNCPNSKTCAYCYLFETPIEDSTMIMRKYTQAPHPFVFEPDDNKRFRVQRGETITHSLVLVGKAANYLPYFFLAIEHLGRNGLGGDLVPFRIDHMSIADSLILFKQPRESCFDAAQLRDLQIVPGASRNAVFRVELRTPTRITIDGRITSTPTLVDIVKALTRRIFLLWHFHCDGGDTPLPDCFIEAAKTARCLSSQLHWRDADRYSTRQKQRVPIGGVVGQITCRGDFGLLEPLLRAGEYVHVGKNATFGLGKLVVTEGG